ncbi:hypothetical protein [Kitasatospora sp. CB01950]|uniref:hypothetical protein n=1 Tax=Kitasatospora sp. CB01950 TaxID=1703930 RepID=UPI00093E7D64|nr:hypothetical protein [Kitasatospora sp. CB01950]OKJ16767.1 hypothetical protein AMK19_00890 [Kitasatospora sp. CB01950]
MTSGAEPHPADALTPFAARTASTLRALVNHDPAAAGAGPLALHVVGWAWNLDAGERALREALRDGPVGAADAHALGRAAALIGAAEAATRLAARSAHVLPAEAELTLPVVSALVPALVVEATSALARPAAVRAAGAERLRGTVVAQFPWLVHGFASEAVDGPGLAEALRLGAPLPVANEDEDEDEDVDKGGAGSGSGSEARPRGGCSPVQALPGLVGGPALEAAGAEVQSLAKSLLAAGDELHRRMAELPTEPEGSPTGCELAAAYETLYAAAACLALWSAGVAVGPLWLRTALRALLVRLHRLLLEPPPVLDPYPAEELLAVAFGAGARLLTFCTGPEVSAQAGVA